MRKKNKQKVLLRFSNLTFAKTRYAYKQKFSSLGMHGVANLKKH